MTLKFKIDAASLNELDDNLKSLYKDSGNGVYQLDVEGAADKSKLDEFRANNIELMRQAEKFKNVDLDKYQEIIEKERKLRDKELIDAGDIDKLIEERTRAIKSDYEAKLSSFESKLSDSDTKYTQLVTRHEIEGAAAKSFSEHKINPDVASAVMADIKSKFFYENGQVIGRDGDKILTGDNGNLTIGDYVKSLPEVFKIQSSGGVGKGQAGNAHANSSMTSTQRIAAALKAKAG